MVGSEVVGDTVGDSVGSEVVGPLDGEVVGSEVVGEVDGDVVGSDVVGEAVGSEVVGVCVGDSVASLVQCRFSGIGLTESHQIQFQWPVRVDHSGNTKGNHDHRSGFWCHDGDHR